MSVTYEDIIGCQTRSPGPRISDLAGLPACMRDALIEYYGRDLVLTPAQAWAVEHGILAQAFHYLVFAPTNSGKTLIAWFKALTNVLNHGGRSVCVVPLKSLAEEKLLELERIVALIYRHGGPQLKVAITTGDYQQTDDFLGSPPPESGEIVVCTPERLEVMLRNPENVPWARAVSTFILDEFHLLGDHRRGACYETLITRLLAYCPWSTLVALSATVGGSEKVKAWIARTGRQTEMLVSDYRFPPLRRSVVVAGDKNEFICQVASKVLASPGESLLVFVYTKGDARALAQEIGERTGLPQSADFFHSGLSLASRRVRWQSYLRQDTRVLVTTTSLKMGVNLPANHVIIRDHVFHDAGGRSHLTISDVLQMMGRAGRGEYAGEATLICSQSEDANRYAQLLASGHIDELKPQLLKATTPARHRRQPDGEAKVDPVRGVVLSEICRLGQATPAQVEDFLRHTFTTSSCGPRFGDVRRHIASLEHQKLVFQIPGSECTYASPPLGRTVSMTGISPESGSLLAGFLRALINLDERRSGAAGDRPNYLARLRDLDFLYLSLAAHECRDSWLRLPSKKAMDEVEEYIEALDPEEKPLLNLWRNEDSVDFPTRRLLSSLHIAIPQGREAGCRRVFLQVLGTAVLMHRHAGGAKMPALADEYGIDVGEIENGLKYKVTWVLSCLSQICDPRRCYKLEFLKMRILGLLEDIRFGSNLGKLLEVDGIGRRTVEKLLEAGVDSMEALMGCTEEQQAQLGIDARHIRKIITLIARRSR